MGSAYSKKEHSDEVFVNESLNNINFNEGCLNLDKDLNIAERIFGVEYEKIIDNVFVTHVTVVRQVQSWALSFEVILKTNCGVLISLRKQRDSTSSIEFRRKLVGTIGYGLKVYDVIVIDDSKSSFPFSCLIDLLKEMFTTCSASKSKDFAMIIFYEISQRGYFELYPNLNVARRVFGYNYKSIVNDTTVTHVSVYKCPLEGKYRSSDAYKRELIGRQRTSVDYHTFVVLKTSCGICLSLEYKQRDGIYIGWSKRYDDVVDGMQSFPRKGSEWSIRYDDVVDGMQSFPRKGSEWSKRYDDVVDGMRSFPRKGPVDLVIEDSSDYNLRRFLVYLDVIVKDCSDYRYNKKCQNVAKIIFDEITSTKTFKLHSHLSVFSAKIMESLFGWNYEKFIKTTTVTHVSVYKCPLEGIYRSSVSSIRKKIGRQWTSVDYHAFVVLKTSCGVSLSLEKQRDGIYIGRSIRLRYYDDVVDAGGIRSFPRKGPVNLEIEDSSDYNLKRFLVYLDAIVKDCSDYSVTDKNCQDFAKRIFDKIASTKTWNYTRPKEYLYKAAIIFGILFLIMFLWS